MFTGIVQGVATVEVTERRADVLTFTAKLPDGLVDGLAEGASVALDGVCLTATAVDDTNVTFDLIEETLACTTFADVGSGSRLNVERAMKFGDEIGGHLVAGHVSGTATIERIDEGEHGRTLSLGCSQAHMRGILPKGFIAIDGISLTVGVVDGLEGRFEVHLIPETLRITTIAEKQVGDKVNIELDPMTVAAIEGAKRAIEAGGAE